MIRNETTETTSTDALTWGYAAVSNPQPDYVITDGTVPPPYCIFAQSDGQTLVNYYSNPYDIAGMAGIGLDFVLLNPNGLTFDPITVGAQVSADGVNWTTLDIVPTMPGMTLDSETRHIGLIVHSRYLRVVATSPTGMTDFEVGLVVFISEAE